MLAAILSALIADAAIETFWHASPVRWVVLSIALVALLALAALWQRAQQARGIIAVIGFAAVLAIPAWLPEGLENGVRLLGLSTSTVLSLAVFIGIVLATAIVGFERRLPSAVRLIAAALSAYGAFAFVYGLATDVSFHALLSGTSFWRPLPYFLQGTVFSGAVLISIAAIVTIVRAGVRRPSDGSHLRALQQGVALVAALCLVSAALPWRAGTTSKPAAQSSGALDTETAARLASMENSFRALDDGERQAPRDRWDPDYVVQQLGRDHKVLFAWVRDNTFWIPYHGVLRGPVGVLMDRQGNSLDRALLLATLLEKAGHTVRLAHGHLTREQVRDVLPALVTRRTVALHTLLNAEPLSGSEPDIKAIAESYHLDPATVDQRIEAQARAVASISSELESRVATHTHRLLAAIGKPDPANGWDTRLDAATAACRDHWWVQTQNGDTWNDLDLLAPSAMPGEALTSAVETWAPDKIPAELHHEIVLRVIAERWSAGVLKQASALEQTIRPSELSAHALVLQFWPASWPVELDPDPNARFGFRAAALGQTEWKATLQLDQTVLTQGTIRATGAVAATHGNQWGGMGGGIAGWLRPQGTERSRNEPAPELTGVWIEHEIHIPGESPRIVRRVVFDLLGPSMRAAAAPSRMTLDADQRLTRSLSLMMRTELLPLAADLAPEFAVHVSAQSVLGNRQMLRAIARSDSRMEAPQVRTLLADAAPGVPSLFAIALGRRMGRSDVYLERPNLLTRHQYPALVLGQIVLRDAIDIVANETGVDLGEPDAFSIRLGQGVLDTNVEALLHVAPGAVENVADAFTASDDWVAILPSDRRAEGDLEVSPDLLLSLSADLDNGDVVVTPRRPVSGNSRGFVGWWRIDPSTGQTLGVAPSGWGQAMGERGVQYNVIAVWAKEFAFAYAFCQAVPQVANQAAVFLQGYRDQLPAWLPPLAKAQDPAALFQNNSRGCLIAAMIQTGVTATLPFLLMTYRGLIAMGTRGSIRVPPSLGGPGPYANPFAKTEPGVMTKPGANPFAKTEAGVMAEPGANPFGKTEPGVPKTEPGAPPPPPSGPPPGSPKPASEAEALENLRNAVAAEKAATGEAADAGGEYIRYQANRPKPLRNEPGDPNYDPQVARDLKSNWDALRQEWQQSADNLAAAQRAARDATAAARGAGGKGGFPPPKPAPLPPAAPNFPGCPPNCGNNSRTGPAGAAPIPGSGQQLVGLSGASSFYPLPWK